MYQRYILLEGYIHGRHRPGIIRGMADRRYWKRRSGKRSLEFEEIFGWLNEHLPQPPRDLFQGGKGLCWFKPGADESLKRMKVLAEIHRALGAVVQELRHPAPGKITYEDEQQIVAVPALNVRFRTQARLEALDVPAGGQVD